ncbi:Arginyl tRNA synthetase N terminal domain [Trypanosoma vivax]|uniref:arginine--tRNA ligase n=1 Tax=Trypanosoma vivax (strain Y486) TaxID=1055687 RepID=G0UA80_TRYVY|nr:putative arginyl-tRNA synthetase [Trypanosoma vivax]KAH8617981.1 Arginyl tRNA synthetase N terminal domain [Trypanosoma vivax]CCC52712.1 putative arginyl-tRNA synthetase [Trypanosoma vivax Y486]
MSGCTFGANVELLLKDVVRRTIQVAFPSISVPDILITLGKVTDYQCNNAMGLAKLLSTAAPPIKMSPSLVGEELKKHLVSNEIIEMFEPTPQGFINITIKPLWISTSVSHVLREGIRPPSVPKQKVLVDFSSPNVAKEMHVGHLRSTIIGEAISRLFEFCQHEVHRINHIGDWGTAFGMLILYMKRQHPNFISEMPDIADLTKFYKEAKKCFDEDPDFKEQARLQVVKLQSLEDESIKAWKIICEISRKEFSLIYDRLGVRIEERGESFYNPLIPKVLKLLEDAGKLEDSEGAKIAMLKEKKLVSDLEVKDMAKLAVPHLVTVHRDGKVTFSCNMIRAMREVGVLSGEDGNEKLALSKKDSKPLTNFDARTDIDKLIPLLQPLYKKQLSPLFREAFEAAGVLEDDVITIPRFSFPLMLVKSDGGYTYDTTDITSMYHRFVMEKMDRVIYCTDVGQLEHFKMCAEVVKDMGWMDGATWSHAGFGLVMGADGKKIKTRSGESAKLKDLLDEAVERSHAILVEREDGERAQGHTEEEMRELSKIIGIGAIKYFDLKQSRVSDYAFNYDKMLDLTGNTAVFLLYQYARLCSIERKTSVGREEFLNTEVVIDTPQEKKLALCALRMNSVVLKTIDDLFLHHLTDFAYELVSCFSDFFQNCKVIGHTLEKSRLCLVELTRITLKQVLDILNIEVAERI